ncbi:MAG: tRNA (guanosine(37)-N1)-methyltransferase TrmD [Candidatus Shapirobacteria bacterium]|jgi:tRNA (guanine37-N1)-methyltransferase
MKIDVVTLFPKMFESPFAESMMKRAIDKKILELNLHDMRQWAWNDYGAVDDKPFGGNVGMLIRADVIAKALDEIKSKSLKVLKFKSQKSKIILTSARGKRLTQKNVEKWAKLDNLVIVCGHYEGFDQRVADYMVDEEVSIGDFVLTGGEIPAMLIVDAVTRLLPGVLGKDESSKVESFSKQEVGGKIRRVVEYPQYTRPRKFLGHSVPEVLLSGDPKKIKEWQREQIKI